MVKGKIRKYAYLKKSKNGFPIVLSKREGFIFDTHALVHLYQKGLQRQCLIGSAVAGFNNARTITKASAKGLDTRQDGYNKGICSPGTFVNNPVS